MSDALGATVGGLFSLAQSAVNYGIQSALTREQNQFNFDMWKTQAEYNSPVQQMKRYSEAGLNPYLVASQGNPGNMTTAPVKSVPQAEVRGMDKLAQAFNIEGLLTQHAERKLKEEEAKDAHINRLRNESDFQGNLMFHNNYVYDINTGRYIYSPLSGFANVSDPLAERYYMSKVVPQTYLPYHRAQLIGSQRAYLVPQISMANYEAQHYPVTYWVGTIGKGAKAVSDITGVFNPSRYLMPIGKQIRGFVTPTGRVLNY